MPYPVLYSSVLSYDRWGQYAELITGGISAAHFWPLDTFLPVGTLLAYGPGQVFRVISEGVSGSSGPGLPFPSSYRFSASDVQHGTVVAWGGCTVVDATGFVPLGWDVCVGSTQVLMQVSNPTATNRTVGPCFQQGTKKVFIDSDSTITAQAGTFGQGFNGNFTGLHLQREWDVDSESLNASLLWRHAAQSPNNYFVEYVSVDRLSPTAEKKHGAVYLIPPSGAGPARGYGYMDGMVVELTGTLRFGNFTGRNVMNLWFENCDWNVSGHITCDWNVSDTGFAATGDDIDVVFSMCRVDLAYTDTAFRDMRGRWSFEGTTITQVGSHPFMHFSRGYFEIDFKGCDLSGIPTEAILFDLFRVTASGGITMEECTGFSRSQLPDISKMPYSRYTIDVVGGTMDGEYDPFRYLRISDMYIRERVRDVYRYSSPKYIGVHRVSDRCETSRYMSPKQEFAVVTDFQIPVTSGLQKLTMYLLLPEEPDRDSLWVDISYPGEGSNVGFSSSREVDMLSLSAVDWVGGDGVPYEFSFFVNAGSGGNVLISLYAAWPDKVFYVCPNITVERYVT